jgi:hypothetical protein
MFVICLPWSFTPLTPTAMPPTRSDTLTTPSALAQVCYQVSADLQMSTMQVAKSPYQLLLVGTLGDPSDPSGPSYRRPVRIRLVLT